jgi:hypothetical protein
VFALRLNGLEALNSLSLTRAFLYFSPYRAFVDIGVTSIAVIIPRLMTSPPKRHTWSWQILKLDHWQSIHLLQQGSKALRSTIATSSGDAATPRTCLFSSTSSSCRWRPVCAQRVVRVERVEVFVDCVGKVIIQQV